MSRFDPFNRLFHDNYDFLYRCARRRVRARDIEDVIQEVFMIAHRHFEDPQCVSRGWLYQVLSNVSNNHNRKEMRGQTKQRRFHEAQQVARHGRQDIDTSLDMNRQLKSFFSTLSANQRKAFELFELEGYTGREVEQEFGVNKDTAYSQRRSARKAFKNYLTTAPHAPQLAQYVASAKRRHEHTPAQSRERVHAMVLASIGQSSLASGPVSALGLSWSTALGSWKAAFAAAAVAGVLVVSTVGARAAAVGDTAVGDTAVSKLEDDARDVAMPSEGVTPPSDEEEDDEHDEQSPSPEELPIAVPNPEPDSPRRSRRAAVQAPDEPVNPFVMLIGAARQIDSGHVQEGHERLAEIGDEEGLAPLKAAVSKSSGHLTGQ